MCVCIFLELHVRTFGGNRRAHVWREPPYIRDHLIRKYEPIYSRMHAMLFISIYTGTSTVSCRGDCRIQAAAAP